MVSPVTHSDPIRLDGNKVKKWREVRGFKSQKALATKAGCAEKTVWEVEANSKLISLRIANEIAGALEVPLEELLPDSWWKWLKPHWKPVVILVVILLSFTIAFVLWPRPPRITSLHQGGTVNPFEKVRGTPVPPTSNYYLVVQSLETGDQWILGRISPDERPEWSIDSRFGDPGKNSGVQYRVYILRTASTLLDGLMKNAPSDKVELSAIEVTRK
jgi:DNA-binding XRE family transcriptional regulator